MICTKIMNVSIYLGSPRTRRALPPSYLSIPGHTECLDSQTLPGDSHSGKCIPAIKPAYCSEAAWADLALDSGLDACYEGIEADCKICFLGNYYDIFFLACFLSQIKNFYTYV